MQNSRTRTIVRTAVTTAIATAAIMVGIYAAFLKPTPTTAVKPVPTVQTTAPAPTATAKFQRPTKMEYVPKTNSCIVGGTVTATWWHLGPKSTDKVVLDSPAAELVDSNKVDYTSFTFKADNGQVFTGSQDGAVYNYPGMDLGLELSCDPATMKVEKHFGVIAIIYGGM